MQGYIDALKGIIDAINLILGREELNDKINELNDKIEGFESNENKCKSQIKTLWGILGKTAKTGGTLETQIGSINQEVYGLKIANETAEENLKKTQKDLSTANSRVKRLIFATCASCIATLVSLGCVFQNELKNACDTVCKKVLELKDKMLNK